MKEVKDALTIGAREESGLWEVLNDVSRTLEIPRELAFSLIQRELSDPSSESMVYIIKSSKLYSSDDCVIINPPDFLRLTLADVEFRPGGPFYYISSLPMI